MKIIRSKEFTAERAWSALDVCHVNGIATRLQERHFEVSEQTPLSIEVEIFIRLQEKDYFENQFNSVLKRSLPRARMSMQPRFIKSLSRANEIYK